MKREMGVSHQPRGVQVRLMILACLLVLMGSALCLGPSERGLYPGITAGAQSGCPVDAPPGLPTTVVFSAFFGEKLMYKLPAPVIAGDTLTFTLDSSPTPGGPVAANLDSKTGILRYQPLVMGPVTFTIKVTNCKGLSASTPVTINILTNPNRPNIITPQFSSKKGLFIDGDNSNIRAGATMRVSRPGSSQFETFTLEFQPGRNQWAVLAKARVQSTPGKKNIRDVIPVGVETQLVVVSDDIPSAPFIFKR
ncbi:MAG: Ig domain-containing protein [Blastocatellia bacterium]|nr:Ig domain-containing protein [Blastocatellia bacterium]